MAVFSWLLRRFIGQRQPRHSPARQTARRFCPHLEVLEDRCVPSTLKVTNFSSSATVKGSLPYEIAHASSSGKDTIIFDPSVHGTLTLYSQLSINAGVTIKGPGAGVLTLTTNYNFGD